MHIPFFSKKEAPPPPPPPHKMLKLTLLGLGILIVLFSIVFFFAPRPLYTDGFLNLQAIITYAKNHDEHISIETSNTIKPSFDKYYSRFIPTWKSKLRWKLDWILDKLHLHKAPLFSADFFKTQLENLCKLRESKGLKDNYIVKITTSPQSRFVVFGNLQGAYHSLVRNLEKLKELTILDNSLTLTNPNYFILLMGDVVSRSPYTMETLSLVMKLMEKNPDNIVYLKGNHETNNYWQEHTLKTELQIRAAHLSKDPVPLANLVSQFFNTLPLAAYIMINDNHMIRLSETARNQNPLLTEGHYAGFLLDKTTPKIATLNLDEKTNIPGGPVTVSVIIKNEKKRETYQPMEGLRLLAPDEGSVAWNLLSCPTPVYQQAIKFVHDAFIIITPGATPDDWKITLYNRDSRTKDPFKATQYSMISGQIEGGASPITTQTPQQPASSTTTPPQPAPTPTVTPTPAVPTPTAAIKEEVSAPKTEKPAAAQPQAPAPKIKTSEAIKQPETPTQSAFAAAAVEAKTDKEEQITEEPTAEKTDQEPVQEEKAEKVTEQEESEDSLTPEETIITATNELKTKTMEIDKNVEELKKIIKKIQQTKQEN